MKLADFNALCRREWASGCGDVRALILTADSRRELTEDAIADGNACYSLILKIREEDVPEVGAGALLTELPNSLTHTIVKISTGTFADFVQVGKPVIPLPPSTSP